MRTAAKNGEEETIGVEVVVVVVGKKVLMWVERTTSLEYCQGTEKEETGNRSKEIQRLLGERSSSKC